MGREGSILSPHFQMKKCLLVLCMCTVANAVGFRVAAVIPYGEEGFRFVPCFDSDRDGALNLIFETVSSGVAQVHFWEYCTHDRFVLDDSIVTQGGVQTVGFLDGDSLVDMLHSTWDTLRVYESPAINSHPKQVVWRWGELMDCRPAKICDLDRDGRREILAIFGRSTLVFETTGDNQYTQVWLDTSLLGDYGLTVGDFDLDGRTDIVTAQGEFGQVFPNVHIFECFGDNDYREVFMDSLPTPNNGLDLFSGNDMDGNGKPEFLINSSGGGGGTWIMVLWLYEMTGDNQYDYFCVDSIGPIPGRTETYTSLCADIDSDGKEEIIWSVRNNWLVYKAVGVHQYQRVFVAYPLPGGSGVDCTVLSSADFNGNGYPEVVESAFRNAIPPEHWTKVWEIEGVRLHRPNGGEILTPGSQFPITWEKFSPPGADSFSLFVSFDNALTFETITTGLTASDTMYLWSIPDTLADSVKLMIWAYGPPRPGQDFPRGTAWDFSDSSFAIRQTEVREVLSNEQRAMSLKILQNPTTAKQGIRLLATSYSPQARLQIYDVAGKLVRSFLLSPMPSALCSIALHLNPGIYFITLQCEGKTVTRKLVVVE